MNKNTRLGLAAAILVVLGAGAYWFAGSGKSNAGKAPPPPVPVLAAKAELGSMPVLFDTVGRAEAYEGVTLKSRLDGQVASVAYTEGQQVKAGDVLVRLDPGDYNARLLQAEANLARDEAQRAKTRADVERYVSLRARGFVSEEKVNEVRTSAAAAEATVKADQAAVELARLQLSYTVIRAPFAGVVGARLVFPGSAVKTNDTALAVVNRVKPIYVTFSVPERHLPQLRGALADGAMKVSIALPGQPKTAVEGSVRFIDNAVDATTGTILMKAVLDNADAQLTPGQFLNVSMRLRQLDEAVLVPAEAIQQGAGGNFLYAVKEDSTVEVRKVEVIATYGGRAALAGGVAAGETVVTDGQLRLAPGTTVRIKDKGDKEAAPAAAAAPATASAAPAAAEKPAAPAPAAPATR